MPWMAAGWDHVGSNVVSIGTVGFAYVVGRPKHKAEVHGDGAGLLMDSIVPQHGEAQPLLGNGNGDPGANKSTYASKVAAKGKESHVIRVDYNTYGGGHEKFARLLILVDLNKPLLSCIYIDITIQKLEYEGSQQIYFVCEVYVHATEQCRQANGYNDGKADENAESDVHPDNTCSEHNLYGPWMVGENRRRRINVLGTQVGTLKKVDQRNFVDNEAYLASNPARKSKTSKKRIKNVEVMFTIVDHSTHLVPHKTSVAT
ncbi:hypothetical protein GQ457_17G006040 [Hibiscus cannabinus]